MAKELINKAKYQWQGILWEHNFNGEIVDKLLSCHGHHLMQIEKGFQDYLLQKEMNWFGRIIPKDTLYIQMSKDYWIPSIDGARIPAMQLDFYTVKNNADYFTPFDWNKKPDPVEIIL